MRQDANGHTSGLAQPRLQQRGVPIPRFSRTQGPPGELSSAWRGVPASHHTYRCKACWAHQSTKGRVGKAAGDQRYQQRPSFWRQQDSHLTHIRETTCTVCIWTLGNLTNLVRGPRAQAPALSQALLLLYIGSQGLLPIFTRFPGQKTTKEAKTQFQCPVMFLLQI